jgi:predicted phosphodiesterase
MPRLRIAHLTDLHVGATTANRWHNAFLSDQPEATAAATVAAVNRERPDVVLITGDISDTATDDQLRRARGVLDGLEAPWVVCRGNHDVTQAGDRNPLERAFGTRAPVGLVDSDTLPLPDSVALVVLDADWRTEGGRWVVFVPETRIERVAAQLATSRPELLLVVCHFPFVRQSDYIRSRDPDGRNAGTLWHGEQTLASLARRAATTLCFTGHQHFHHVATGDSWLHCTTASLAEYPAEYRVIDVDPGGVTIRTCCAVPDLIAANPPLVTWVRGREEDRQVTWRGKFEVRGSGF